jgi:hypothetical protein
VARDRPRAHVGVEDGDVSVRGYGGHRRASDADEDREQAEEPQHGRRTAPNLTNEASGSQGVVFCSSPRCLVGGVRRCEHPSAAPLARVLCHRVLTRACCPAQAVAWRQGEPWWAFVVHHELLHSTRGRGAEESERT